MAPTTLTFFEHQFLPYKDIPVFPKDARRRDRVLEEIERLNRSAGQEILSVGHKGLTARAQVGVVRVGEIQIEILPKIDAPDPPGGPAAHTAGRNLLWMLAYAGDIRIVEQDAASLAEQPGSWFELLTRLFAVGLYREVLSGLAHLYVSEQATLPALRGRWDIQRQFARLRQARPDFDVIVDEFTADVPLNQVFRWVVERLFELTLDDENRRLLGELREWFGLVSLLPQATLELAGQVHFTRLNDRFQPAFNMARLFLSASAVRPAGGDLAGYAFTFDMNVLFERFMAAFISHHRASILPERWRGAAIVVQADGRPVYLAQVDGQPVLRLRPDLLLEISVESSPVLIADTKYKTLRPGARGAHLSEEDVYQMLAYSTRFGCPRLLLLYPQTTTAGKLRQVVEIASPHARLLAATLDLRRPLSTPALLQEELRAVFSQAADFI
jgi:5-methylcytosine-specific restriction enzyme subunit McrC